MAAARRDMAGPKAEDELRRKRKKHEQLHGIPGTSIDRNDPRSGDSKISFKIQFKSNLPPQPTNAAGPLKQPSSVPPSLDPASVGVSTWSQSANLVAGTPGTLPRDIVPSGGPIASTSVKKEKKKKKRERDEGLLLSGCRKILAPTAHKVIKLWPRLCKQDSIPLPILWQGSTLQQLQCR